MTAPERKSPELCSPRMEGEEDYEEGIEFEASSSRMKKTGKNTNGNKRKAVVEDEAGSKKNVNGKGIGGIFKSGQIKQPRNPYFVAQPRKRRELHIPSKVIKNHKLKIPDEIIITSEDGWEFVATIATRGDGRKVISDGWKAFCVRYKVKEEDRCLCEFFPPQNQKVTLMCPPIPSREMDSKAMKLKSIWRWQTVAF